MFNVLTLNKISDTGLTALKNEKYNIVSECATPDGIILRSFEMKDYPLNEELKAVARAGAGVNNIPIPRCSEKGIVVFNTPGANANAVKEMTIAGLLLSNRKIVDGINWVQSLAGQEGVAKLVEKGKVNYVGGELAEKKLGVVGLGAIGVLVANAALHLGMEVIGYDPFLSVEAAWKISRGVQYSSNIDEIFEKCDYITLHLPFNSDTKYLVNKEKLGKAKKGVHILNFARGEIVENAAIIEAVKAGTVGRYVTDFPTEELLGIENIITIPHLAASTPEAEENCAKMASNQLRDFLETGNIKNSVNFPDCSLPYSGKRRVCVIHKNVPGIIAPITNAIAEVGINIANMINKSKGELAYTIVDLDGAETAETDKKLQEVSGVIKVRII